MNGESERGPSRRNVVRMLPVILFVATAACTGGHRYGVPRTLPPGAVAHHLSVDLGDHVVEQGGDGGAVSQTTTVVPIPAYDLRVGLADRLELGLGLAGDSSAQVDLKVQLLRSRWLDLAVAPTVGGALNLPMRFGSEVKNAGFATLPLLVGLQLGEVTLVPAAAVGYLGVDSKAPPEDPSAAEGGVFWSGSLAAFFPVSPGLRLGPGLGLLKPPGDELDWQLVGGLTVALGDSPE